MFNLSSQQERGFISTCIHQNMGKIANAGCLTYLLNKIENYEKDKIHSNAGFRGIIISLLVCQAY